MLLRLILLIVIESIRRLIDVQIKFRYILMINSSRLMRPLRIERSRKDLLLLNINGIKMTQYLKLGLVVLMQMANNLHYSGLLDQKEHHRDRRTTRLWQTCLIQCRERISIGKIELIIQSFLLHRENREEIMLHGGIMPLSRLKLILILLWRMVLCRLMNMDNISRLEDFWTQMVTQAIQMLEHSMIQRNLLRLLINSIVDICTSQLVVLLNTRYF
mgnify:CR=1 FL=1